MVAQYPTPLSPILNKLCTSFALWCLGRAAAVCISMQVKVGQKQMCPVGPCHITSLLECLWHCMSSLAALSSMQFLLCRTPKSLPASRSCCSCRKSWLRQGRYGNGSSSCLSCMGSASLHLHYSQFCDLSTMLQLAHSCAKHMCCLCRHSKIYQHDEEPLAMPLGRYILVCRVSLVGEPILNS